MPFNIEQFKSNGLILSGARPSQFEIRMTGWPASGSVAPQKVTLLAKASSAPPSIIDSVDVPYFGRKIKVYGDRIYPNWAVTFMNDEDFNLRDRLEAWHNAINTPDTNLMVGTTPLVTNQTAGTTSYKQDMEVIHYGKAGNIIRIYKIYGAFPVSIDAIPLDWDATNQFEQYNVEFAYDYWKSGDGNSEYYTQIVGSLINP